MKLDRKPTKRLVDWRLREEVSNLSNERAMLPKMAGIAMMKAKEKVVLGFNPKSLPAKIVLAEREIPGTKAKAWNRPIPKAFFEFILLIFVFCHFN